MINIRLASGSIFSPSLLMGSGKEDTKADLVCQGDFIILELVN